jgi:hypothetical protein
MADTLVERLVAHANMNACDGDCEEHETSPEVTWQELHELSSLLREAADHIGLLTRSLEIMNKALDEAGKMITTSAQGDGSGE